MMIITVVTNYHLCNSLSLSSTLTISCNIFVSSRNISILSIFHGSLISKRSWFVWIHRLLGRITVLSANYFSFHRKTQNLFSYHSYFTDLLSTRSTLFLLCAALNCDAIFLRHLTCVARILNGVIFETRRRKQNI